jgi:hypothetical protein
MAPKHSRTPLEDRYATKADVAEIHRILDNRRDWLERLEKTCAIQFERIAQIQSELDRLRLARARREARNKRK